MGVRLEQTDQRPVSSPAVAKPNVPGKKIKKINELIKVCRFACTLCIRFYPLNEHTHLAAAHLLIGQIGLINIQFKCQQPLKGE